MSQLQNRQNVIKGIFIVVILILLIKLFYIQIINSEYKFSARNNAVRFEVQQAARGLIYDRNGELLVSNVASYDLMVIPKEVTEIDTLKLCDLSGMNLKEFRKKLKVAADYSNYKESVFSKQLNTTSAHRIQESLNIFNGFYVRVNTTRDYPVDVAAHAIGFLGEVDEEKIKDKYYTKGDLEGKTGIEASYEKQLRGEKGMKMVLVDAHNTSKGSFNNGMHDTLAIHGKNITSTLDINLQTYGELLMTNKIGAIVAIEPSTGEILTLITSPNYNPGQMKGRERSKHYNQLYIDKNKPLFNRALNGTYPPASPLKIINGLIMLEENSLNKNNIYFCDDGFEFGNNKKMKCHEHPPYVNLNTAIAVSCNAYFCNAWEDFFNKYSDVYEGYSIWKKHIESFGLGDYLNNDFNTGNKGFIPKASYFDKYYRKGRWKSSTILSMSIGQGEILSTPIQMANLAVIIANRGFYYIPHIIKEIEGEKIETKFKEKKITSISRKHFETIIDGMQMVLEYSDGTAQNSKIEGVDICGKTGTAENPHGEDHSIFIGFAPRNNPKIAIAVYVENGGWGSTWAAPISNLIIEKYLKGETTNKLLENQMINGNLLGSK